MEQIRNKIIEIFSEFKDIGKGILEIAEDTTVNLGSFLINLTCFWGILIAYVILAAISVSSILASLFVVGVVKSLSLLRNKLKNFEASRTLEVTSVPDESENKDEEKITPLTGHSSGYFPTWPEPEPVIGVVTKVSNSDCFEYSTDSKIKHNSCQANHGFTVGQMIFLDLPARKYKLMEASKQHKLEQFVGDAYRYASATSANEKLKKNALASLKKKVKKLETKAKSKKLNK